jgi:uncharacterized protein with von Willebrand factor type A (vWA) domain
MEQNDLLKLLELDGPLPVEDPFESEETKPNSEHDSLTALEVDDWGLRRGRELLDRQEPLRELDLGEFAVADFLSAAFEPEPHLLPGCVDPQRHQFLKELLETPEYRALHATTLLKQYPSELAAISFAEQFAELRKEKPSEAAVWKHVGKALLKAREEVETSGEIAAALGMGLGGGSPGSNDTTAIATIFRRVRNHPKLLRICTLAGRYRRLAQAKQRQKISHGLDDLVGVAPDRDIGRLLPVELARLAIPELEDDLLRRLVEGQTLCREYRGIEPVGKGPILVVLDESGSMSGEKIETGKAIALALAWIARHQKRWAGLIAYSGDSGHRLLALPPTRWNEAKLCDWLQEFIGCGSTLDLPIRELPEFYRQIGAPAGRTDILFVTDAICRIEPEDRVSFLLWKQRVSARVISLVIENTPGDLALLSDETHLVKTLSVTEPAVGRVLSL